ncbi:restriction endonuclease subunit S [uncultured Anaerovibrio sp.]|uniref:restriction endonuclease subunit S n=1 Tax=uncultured Anaerovibrio sp. TaxID=361586 RepID=UPI00260B4CCE|nr:restriction endonuclease subunit S [uncultured Anaerovibrio sp.]
MIDTEALRKKVIDLAIQGKLTEQLPEDGNAEELYQQIQVEKTQLINEKKIKKEKPLPEITAVEIPFEIPGNWKWVRLRDVCRKIVDGDHNPPTGINEPTEYLMLSAKNINDDKIIEIDDVRYLTKEVFEEENKRTNLEIGDVLLTIVATLGRSCVYREKYNVCFQRSVCVITTLLNPDYLKRVFDAGFIQKLMVEGATGAAQPGFYLNKVEKMCIPVPPLSQQKRIVAKIDEVLAEIKIIDELQSQYASNVEVLKSKIIDAGIRGQLTEQLPEDGTAEELLEECRKEKSKIKATGVLNGRKKKNTKSINEDEIPFSIPRTWKWVRLGDVAEIFGRIGFRGYNRKDIVEKGKGAITISPSNIINYGKTVFDKCTYLSWEKYDESPEIMIEEDDVIIVKTGSSYGKCGIVKDLPEKATINPQLAVFKYILCDKCYLNYVLNSSMAKKQYDEFVVGAAIPTFSQEKLGNLCFPLPPLSEQKRIVAKIDSVLGAIGK